MKAQITESASSSVSPEEVRQALDHLLWSRYFVNAHKKQKFLRLICDYYLEGRAQDLNEHLLGYDVFGRDNSYNPSNDPIVRVFAHEIRKKLEAYYASEGAADPVRLEIPAGSYQPVFTRQKVAPAEATPAEATPRPAAAVEAPPPPAAWRWPLSRILAGGVGLALVAAVLVLGLENRQLRQEVASAEAAKDPAAYGSVWATFLADKNPPLVILSNPPILRFINASDPESTVKNSIPLSDEAVEALKDKFVTNPEVAIKESVGPTGDSDEAVKSHVVVKRNLQSRLVLSTNIYTGMGEAIGLHYLGDFFRRTSRSIQFKQSRTLSADDLKKHNVIMLGGVWVNAWSSKLTRNEDFAFTSKATIENRRPQAGEEREYIPQFDQRTGNLNIDYALITVKPNISEGNDVMMLAGVYSQGTEAAAEYVTHKEYLDQLNQRLQQAGSPPRYFQALLKVSVENGIPTTVSILALHELRVADF
ncbi:MAG TPA: hypothetical protein VKA60_06650 [Blastocatellia bacterium]|nr:hypothetical protein [Blastocatellia bacterium]